eukprot:8334191-Ditylum_brightwellii.AAC.1
MEIPVIGVSIAYDAAKVSQVLQMDPKYTTAIGGVGENRFTLDAIVDDDSGDTDNPSRADIIAHLKEVLKDPMIVKASEIKVIVLSFQNTGNNTLYLILADKPQTTNEESIFNECISELIAKAVEEYNEAQMKKWYSFIINAANDGALCNKDFVVKILCSFLQGDLKYNLGTNNGAAREHPALRDGPVNVFDDKSDDSVASCIWSQLRPIINEVEKNHFISSQTAGNQGGVTIIDDDNDDDKTEEDK